MFDTHCHLNFKAFKKILPDVLLRAKAVGVNAIMIPGTDVKTSTKAVEIANEHDGIFAAVGIHPHHVFKLMANDQIGVNSELTKIEELLLNSKVLAVGEIGMDRHEYEETVYKEYQIDSQFLSLQKELLEKQIQLAVKHNKSLILHNREAKEDLLPIVQANWNATLASKTVFHCCEPDEDLLEFAKVHTMFIGIDGDITYTPEKQAFMKKVPLEMLVIETDSPFLLPEPLKTQRKFPNEPANIAIIVEMLAEIKNVDKETIILETMRNAKQLFGLKS